MTRVSPSLAAANWLVRDFRPNQRKVLGLVPATDEQKDAARKTTLYATRANFILSVPLLLCMGSAGHGLPF